MLVKWMGVFLFVTLVAAELPSYFKVCKRRDPNLDKCVVDAVIALREKLRVGIPELDVPPVEPLSLRKFVMFDTPTIKSYANDVKVFGLSDYGIDNVHVDFDKKSIEINSVFKKVNLDATYDLKAKIVVPIEGRGPIHIIADNVHSHVILNYELVKKNGAEYMHFTSMTTKLNIMNFKTEFEPLAGEDGATIAMAVNAAIKGGHEEILRLITPAIEKVVSSELLKISNNIATHFSFDELFPVTE